MDNTENIFGLNSDDDDINSLFAPPSGDEFDSHEDDTFANALFGSTSPSIEAIARPDVEPEAPQTTSIDDDENIFNSPNSLISTQINSMPDVDPDEIFGTEPTQSRNIFVPNPSVDSFQLAHDAKGPSDILSTQENNKSPQSPEQLHHDNQDENIFGLNDDDDENDLFEQSNLPFDPLPNKDATILGSAPFVPQTVHKSDSVELGHSDTGATHHSTHENEEHTGIFFGTNSDDEHLDLDTPTHIPAQTSMQTHAPLPTPPSPVEIPVQIESPGQSEFFKPAETESPSSLFGEHEDDSLFGANAEDDSPSSLFGGHTEESPASLFGGHAEESPASLFGGHTEESPESLFGGHTEESPASLFGGHTEESPESLMSGHAEESPSSLFGGHTEESTESLFGGHTEESPESLFGGHTEESAASLFGGHAEETPSAPVEGRPVETPATHFGGHSETTSTLIAPQHEESPAGLFGEHAEDDSSSLFGGHTDASQSTEHEQSSSLFGHGQDSTPSSLFGDHSAEPEPSSLFGQSTDESTPPDNTTSQDSTQPGDLFANEDEDASILFPEMPTETQELFGSTEDTSTQEDSLFGSTNVEVNDLFGEVDVEPDVADLFGRPSKQQTPPMTTQYVQPASQQPASQAQTYSPAQTFNPFTPGQTSTPPAVAQPGQPFTPPIFTPGQTNAQPVAAQPGQPFTPPIFTPGQTFAPPPTQPKAFMPGTGAPTVAQPPSAPPPAYAPPPAVSSPFMPPGTPVNPFAPPPAAPKPSQAFTPQVAAPPFTPPPTNPAPATNQYAPPPGIPGNSFAPPPATTTAAFTPISSNIPPPATQKAFMPGGQTTFAPPPAMNPPTSNTPLSPGGNVTFAPPATNQPPATHFAPPPAMATQTAPSAKPFTPATAFSPAPTAHAPVSPYAPPPPVPIPGGSQFAPPPAAPKPTPSNQFAPPPAVPTPSTAFTPKTQASQQFAPPPPVPAPAAFTPHGGSQFAPTGGFAPPPAMPTPAALPAETAVALPPGINASSPTPSGQPQPFTPGGTTQYAAPPPMASPDAGHSSPKAAQFAPPPPPAQPFDELPTSTQNVMKRSQTIESIGTKSNAFFPHQADYGHSSSQPCVHAQIPFFGQRRPICAFGFGGIFLRHTGGKIQIGHVCDMYPHDPAVAQLATFTTDKQKRDAFIQGRIKADDSADTTLLWAAIRVRAMYDQNIDIHRFNENVKKPGTPENDFITLLSYGQVETADRAVYSPAEISQSSIDELQRLVSNNSEAESLEYAMAHQMWPFAMILASSISSAKFQEVSTMFIAQTLSTSSLSKVLGALVGHQHVNLECESWRDIVVTTLKHLSPSGMKTLVSLGAALETNKNFAASHVCMLLGSQPLADMKNPFSQVGTDWKHPTISSIQMSQLAMPKTLPSFYPYALIYTMALIDYGYIDVANTNNQHLITVFEKFKQERLHNYAIFIAKMLESISAPSKSPLSGLAAIVDQKLYEFVHGTGPETPNQNQINADILPTSVSIESDDVVGGGQDPFNPMTDNDAQHTPIFVQTSAHQPEPPDVEPTAEPPKSPEKPAAKPEPKSKDEAKRPGLFGRIKHSIFGTPKATVADLDHVNSEPYYDEANGRWVFPDDDPNDAPAPIPPPPPPSHFNAPAPVMKSPPPPGPHEPPSVVPPPAHENPPPPMMAGSPPPPATGAAPRPRLRGAARYAVNQ